MGTRADFYVGRGADAEWLGSVAWDGYPDGFDDDMLAVRTEQAWRTRVGTEIAGRDDGTKVEQGWPWPWETSATTDYAYAFDGDQVWASSFGSPWWPADGDESEDHEGPQATFPDMSQRRAATLGKRSGVIVFGA